MAADGEGEGETVYDAVTDQHPEADIIILPRASGSGARAGRRSAISILQPSKGMVAWAGCVVLATTGEALVTACISPKPSLDGDLSPGLCPVSRSKQRLDAMC